MVRVLEDILKVKRCRRACGWMGLVAFCLAIPLTLASPSSASADYALGPQDKIRIKVHEWRATLNEFVEWQALNDEYVVSSAGTVSLPFAGEVPVAGRTVDQLGSVISGTLMERLSLGRRPSIAIEIVEYRPFYILGEVSHPGEYPYRPGLTVLQSVSIAGGIRRAEGDLWHLERETIKLVGEREQLGQTREELLARFARLEAELEGADSVAFPRDLFDRRGDPAIARLMEQESSIFRSRLDAYQTQMRALAELRAHLERELKSLDGQLAAHDRQMDLLRAELDNVRSLVERGLAVAPRQLSLELAMAQMLGERLRVETSLLRTHQEMSRTEVSMLQLRHERSNEVTGSLRETQSRLDEASSRVGTTERLLRHSQLVVPVLRSRMDTARLAEPRYVIMRRIGGATVEIPAGEASTVEPGDSVKVELPLDPAPYPGLSSLSAPPASAAGEEPLRPDRARASTVLQQR